MKHIVILISLFLVIGCAQKENDADLIQGVFQTYRTSLLSLKGEDATSCLDSKSLLYYENLVEHALTLSKEDYQSLDIMSKLMLARMRLEIPKSQLEKMSGRDFYVYSIEKGWTSSSSVSQIEKLVNITSDGRLAQAAIPQAPQQQLFHFMNENGEWKLSAWKLQSMGEAVFKQQVKDSGMNEDEYIKAILESVSEFKWNDRIYEGPLK